MIDENVAPSFRKSKAIYLITIATITNGMRGEKLFYCVGYCVFTFLL